MVGSQSRVEIMPIQVAQPFADRTQAATIERSLAALEQRELILPCVLFVASHRPFAFVVGQLLYMVGPLAVILGWQVWQDWAAVLSEADGAAWLEQALTERVYAHDDSNQPTQ